MNEGELLAFADLLVRHLASVIAAERGYVEQPCPDCSETRPRRRGAAVVGLPETMSFAGGPHGGLISVSGRSAVGGCATCHGGQRVWARRKLRLRPLSDRELINRAAKESAVSGRTAGGDRPTG
jgi:hypothetical protein